MRLSIVVATLGRETLQATLDSIYSQSEPEDEVIVVHDATEPNLDIATRCEVGGYHVVGEGAPLGYWGHAVRNLAFENWVTGTHVCGIDDDDIYLPGALALMREACCGQPVIFGMEFGNNHPLVGLKLPNRGPKLTHGNVGTPMVVAPVTTARYALQHGGDWTYLRSVRLCGQPIWRDEVIALIRP